MLDNFLISLYFFEIIGFFTIGFVVYLRNKSQINKSFFIFASSIGLWQIFQASSILLYNYQVWSSALFSLSIALSVVTSTALVNFIRVYVGKKQNKIIWIAGIIIGSLSFASSSIRSTTITESGIGVPQLDLFYAIILLYSVLAIGYAVLELLKLQREHSVSSKFKTQAKIMIFAIGVVGTLVILASFYSSEFSDTLLAQQIVPASLFVGLLIFMYAMIYKGLFDIHIFALRAAAYLTSYFLIVFLVLLPVAYFSIVRLELDINASSIILGSFVLVGLVYSLQVIRDLFDKLSFNIFFQNYYDAQELINEHNTALVANTDIETLLSESSEIIRKHLNLVSSFYYLNQTSYIEARFFGVDEIEKTDIKDFTESLDNANDLMKDNDGMLVVDLLGSESLKEREFLNDKSISVVIELSTRLDSQLGHNSSFGYMFLGPKKSGNNYDNNDLRALTSLKNELVLAIQNALRYEEIERFNVTLQEKIDEATKKLRHTNKKLEEMDETKDEFISMASHQLRTPLTSVKGYLSMVLEGDAGEIKPMQERLLSQAYTSSQRMVYLIADLLNVSRLRTGKFVIEPIRTNLATIVEGEVSQLKETAASRKLELVYEKPQKFPDLMLDETKVRQVVMNFIDNAIYYTPAGGTITIELKDKKDAIEYTVSDTGMGVPKADQQHLFTKFYRAGNARKARPDGTGLGLFMAKKVIIEQGGAVIFKSKEGEGSTFGFTFPKDKLTPKETVKKDTDKSA